MQLAKNIKTHIILTYSGTKHFITSEQEIALRNIPDNGKIYTDLGMVRVNTIKEILPIEEYYKEHPDERPQHPNYSISDPSELPKNAWSFSKIRHINALKSMRKGFLQHWQLRIMNDGAKAILERMNKKLIFAEQADDNAIFDHSPGKIFFGVN